MKETASGEFWQENAATLLTLHGGGATIALMMLGALVPVHLRCGWRPCTSLDLAIPVAAGGSYLVG